METLDPGAVASDLHARLDEFLRGPGQNEMDSSATREHRFEEQDVRAGSGAGEPYAGIHGRELFVQKLANFAFLGRGKRGVRRSGASIIWPEKTTSLGIGKQSSKASARP